MEKNFQDNVNISLLLSINDVQLHQIQNQQSQQIDQGILEIYEVPDYEIYMIKLNQFQYTLSKEIPIFASTDQNQRKTFLFPSLDCYYGICLAQNLDSQIFDCLESLFSERANLIYQDFKNPHQDNQVIVEQLELQDQVIQGEVIDEEMKFDMQQRQEQVLTAAKDQQQIPSAQQPARGQKTSKISNYIMRGGNIIRAGLILGANKLSPAIQKGGNYIKSKIKNKKEKEIKPETFAKIAIANTATKAMVTYSRAQIEALIQVGKSIGQEVGKNAANTKAGQKITQHKYYEDAKKIGKSCVHATLGIYDGFFSALSILCSSISKTTSDVVAHKYGEQAGQATSQSLGVAGNIGSMARVNKDALTKFLYEETKSNQPNQPNNNQQQN